MEEATVGNIASVLSLSWFNPLAAFPLATTPSFPCLGVIKAVFDRMRNSPTYLGFLQASHFLNLSSAQLQISFF